MQESQGTCPAGKGDPRACHHLSQPPQVPVPQSPGMNNLLLMSPSGRAQSCRAQTGTRHGGGSFSSLLSWGAQSCCPGGNTDSRGPPPGPVPPLKDQPLTINAASVTKCSKPHAPQLSPPALATVRRARAGSAVSGLTRLPLLPCPPGPPTLPRQQ